MNPSLLARLLWVVVSLFYTYQYVLRILPSIVINDLMNKFAIDATQIGLFSGIYYIGYTLIHIPMGIMLDRFGAKLMMTISVLLTALGLVPMIYSDSWTLVMIGRIITSIGSATSTLGAFKLLRIAYGEEKFGLSLGFVVTAGLLGAACNTEIRGLMDIYGTSEILHIILLTGFGLAAFTYAMIPSEAKLNSIYASNVEQINDNTKNHSNTTVWQDVKHVMSDYRVILIALMGGFMVGPLEGFADAWLMPFLENVYHLSSQQIGIGSKALFIGVCIGFPLVGYIAEETRAYYGTAIVCGVIMLFSFIALLLGIGNVGFEIFGYQLNLVHTLLFLLGFVCGYQICIITEITNIMPIRILAISSATANMIMMIFGTVFHFLIGAIISSNSTDNLTVGAYSSDALVKGFIVVPIAIFIAIIVLSFLALKKRSNLAK